MDREKILALQEETFLGRVNELLLSGVVKDFGNAEDATEVLPGDIVFGELSEFEKSVFVRKCDTSAEIETLLKFEETEEIRQILKKLMTEHKILDTFFWGNIRSCIKEEDVSSVEIKKNWLIAGSKEEKKEEVHTYVVIGCL